MPKIIENLDRRLMDEARRQIEQSGYGAMTIRSVASACSIGVGTVYHYYPSKDALIAAFMLEDWNESIAVIRDTAAAAESPETVVRCIHDQLRMFVRKHQAIVRAESAASGIAGSFRKYHSLLRGQLSEPLMKFCPDGFTADFIAESLLTWTMADKTFDEIYDIISKLF